MATDSGRTAVPMNPAEVRCVWEAVRRCGRQLPPSREHFRDLIGQARTALQASDDPPAQAELASVVALSWMGPLQHPPPPEVRNELLGLVEDLAPGQTDRILDIAIGYGCGWARPVEWTAKGWAGRWDPALNALRDLVRRFVEDAYHRLLRLGIEFPYEPDLLGAADSLLIRLCRPLSQLQIGMNDELVIGCTEAEALINSGAGEEERVPPGAKAVYSVRPRDSHRLRLRRSNARKSLVVPKGAELRVTAMDFETRVTLAADTTETTFKLAVGEALRLSGVAALDIWECTCGHQRCAERHRLANWDPGGTDQTLVNFVASAVKGPGRVVKTGSFTQGMLFALWAREGF